MSWFLLLIWYNDAIPGHMLRCHHYTVRTYSYIHYTTIRTLLCHDPNYQMMEEEVRRGEEGIIHLFKPSWLPYSSVVSSLTEVSCSSWPVCSEVVYFPAGPWFLHQLHTPPGTLYSLILTSFYSWWLYYYMEWNTKWEEDSECPMGSIRSTKKVLESSMRWRAGGGRCLYD